MAVKFNIRQRRQCEGIFQRKPRDIGSKLNRCSPSASNVREGNFCTRRYTVTHESRFAISDGESNGASGRATKVQVAIIIANDKSKCRRLTPSSRRSHNHRSRALCSRVVQCGRVVQCSGQQGAGVVEQGDEVGSGGCAADQGLQVDRCVGDFTGCGGDQVSQVGQQLSGRGQYRGSLVCGGRRDQGDDRQGAGYAAGVGAYRGQYFGSQSDVVQAFVGECNADRGFIVDQCSVDHALRAGIGLGAVDQRDGERVAGNRAVRQFIEPVLSAFGVRSTAQHVAIDLLDELRIGQGRREISQPFRLLGHPVLRDLPQSQLAGRDLIDPVRQTRRIRCAVEKCRIQLSQIGLRAHVLLLEGTAQ